MKLTLLGTGEDGLSGRRSRTGRVDSSYFNSPVSLSHSFDVDTSFGSWYSFVDRLAILCSSDEEVRLTAGIVLHGVPWDTNTVVGHTIQTHVVRRLRCWNSWLSQLSTITLTLTLDREGSDIRSSNSLSCSINSSYSDEVLRSHWQRSQSLNLFHKPFLTFISPVCSDFEKPRFWEYLQFPSMLDLCQF